MRKCSVEGIESGIDISECKHFADMNRYSLYGFWTIALLYQCAACRHAFYEWGCTSKWLSSNTCLSNLELIEGLSPVGYNTASFYV